MKLAVLTTLLLAADPSVSLPVAITGVNGASLAATPVTQAINMEGDGKVTNQLSLTLAVTPGTSLVVDVRCYEAQEIPNWDQISFCDGSTPKSDCVPDVRTFTLAAYSGSVKYIPTRWAVTKKYVKCSADDPADGTGTIVITGARSYR